ncbi:alpha/beta hydrolase [Weissella hellenica]|uniref:Esterase n=1 Tax=Weissella hellenica TaxID=46256 RepID=A0A4Y4G392_WEIHE|nr:alpha/beta hydrolase-fold protein [Weissella hellenica]NKY66786.1 esterase family protein [Weissella hellenica]GED35946.1 peptidase M13 [Weissella hellenica]SCB85605.1 Putative esterase [Weissella hellenica]
MAHLQITRFSSTLQTHMNIGVILPDQLPQAPLPTIWLLHGLGENGTCWPTRTTIENLALNYQVAIIMPNVDRSFYMDEVNGLPYWTYFTKELMPEMQHLLPLSSHRDSNFVIGNSMEGFGALKLGFSHPELFSYIAALSPVINLTDIIPIMPDVKRVFGENDFLKPANDQFTHFMTKYQIDDNYHVSPGNHDWLFWEKEIQKVLAWLPLKRNA